MESDFLPIQHTSCSGWFSFQLLHLFLYICDLSDFEQTIDSQSTSGGLAA